MSKKQFGPTLLVILGLLFIAAIGFRTISTPEIWTHLAQGRTNAPLSYVTADNPVNTTWLYDKLAYSAWNIGGANLLILLNIAGLLGTFLLLLQVAKKWGGPISQGFALLIVGHLMFQSLDVGPQVIMMLCIAATLYMVTTIKKPAILFGALIPIQILWTNMHGSFIYGPLIVALTAIQTAQQSKGAAARTRKKQGIDAGVYAILAVSMFAVTAINPSIFKLHGQVIANIKSGAPSYWSSLFIDYFQIPVLKPLILFVMILGAGGLITLKKRLPLTLTAMAIYSAFLVWTSPKMAMLFAVMAFPFIVLSLTAISEYIHSSLEHMMGTQSKYLIPATSVVLILLFVLSFIPVTSNCAYVKTGSASNFGLGIQEELYPSGAESIMNDPAFPEGTKTINLAADGGYLAFKYPGRKIFIDYRPGRYDKQLLEDLNGMMMGRRKAYDAIMDQYRPEAIIINTLYPSSASGIVTLLSQRVWKLAYFDGTTAILLLDKEEYRTILNNTQAQQAGLKKLEDARAEYARHADSCRAGNPGELIGSGKIFLAFNRPKESENIFALLLQNNARIPGAWIGMGNSQLLLKDFTGAVASLKTATELAPKNLQAWMSYANACKYAADRESDANKKATLKQEVEQAVETARQLAEHNKSDEVEVPIADQPAPMEKQEQGLKDLALPDSL